MLWCFLRRNSSLFIVFYFSLIKEFQKCSVSFQARIHLSALLLLLIGVFAADDWIVVLELALCIDLAMLLLSANVV